MLVTMPISVGKRTKVPSLSSASTIIHWPLPRRAFDPHWLMMPPEITVGSYLLSVNTWAMSEVVVVLPCVPVTDTVE